MKKEVILTTVIVTLTISFISWTGLQIISNALGVTENKVRGHFVEKSLLRIEKDVRFIRESIQ